MAAVLLSVLTLSVTLASASPEGSYVSQGGSDASVSETSTGLVIQNTGRDMLTNLSITVDAQVPGQQATRAFSRNLRRIRAHARVVVAYRSLRSAGGQSLDPTKFAPILRHMTYHDGNETTSTTMPIDTSTGTGSNAMREAIERDDLPAVRRLLVRDPTLVNRRDILKQTPLFYAAVNGMADVAEFLLARHADVNVRDGLGYTPLSVAQLNRSVTVEKLLLAHGAKAGK